MRGDVSDTGKTFAGRYRVEEEVGRGGMAVVYRGIDLRMKRTVAVKVLYPYLAIKSQNKVRFQREAEVVAGLDHRNVVRIYDYSGIESDDNYIVTEFIEGDTLKRFAADHALVLPEVGAMMVREIAAALGHAHDRGVIHRDVKPENVMITEKGVLKLMDFGIAQIKDVQQMTVTGTMIGSPAHMSPEHIEGRSLDQRGDIFSLGTVLYLLCVGRLPFSGSTAHALLKQILEVNYRPAVQVNPAIGTELSAIIDRCLRREPDERYQSCAELRLGLEHYLGQMGFEDIPQELATFFTEPEGYQKRASERVVELLLKRARTQGRSGKLARSLRLYDRALCLAPGRDDIVDEIEKVRRRGETRRFLLRYVAPIGALALVATCGWVLLSAGSFWGAGPPPESLAGMAASDVVGVDVVADVRVSLPDVVGGLADSTVLEELMSSRDSGSDVVADSTIAVAPETLGEARLMLLQAESMRRQAEAMLRLSPVGISRVRDWAAARAAMIPDPKAEVPNPVKEESDSGGREKSGEPKNGGSGHKGSEATNRRAIPVTIVGNPSAVEIWVDGEMRGHGRINDLMLMTGNHTFRLHHPTCLHACKDRKGTFSITPDRDSLELREGIAFKPAMLQVVSAQAGVVFVNTEPVGRTNKIIRLQARDQQGWEVDVAVLFEDDVSPPLKRKVKVLPGKLRKVHADTKP
jgi:hypothetical protein